VIAHDKLSSHYCFKVCRPRPNLKTVQPLRRVLQPVYFNPPARVALGAFIGWPVRISLVRSERGITPRLRNFDTEPLSSYCYKVSIRQSLGKRRQRAHRRRFARPPRFLNRAGLKSRGRRERLRNTRWVNSRNAFDSMMAGLRACACGAVVSRLESQVFE